MSLLNAKASKVGALRSSLLQRMSPAAAVGFDTQPAEGQMS